MRGDVDMSGIFEARDEHNRVLWTMKADHQSAVFADSAPHSGGRGHGAQSEWAYTPKAPEIARKPALFARSRQK